MWLSEGHLPGMCESLASTPAPQRHTQFSWRSMAFPQDLLVIFTSIANVRRRQGLPQTSSLVWKGGPGVLWERPEMQRVFVSPPSLRAVGHLPGTEGRGRGLPPQLKAQTLWWWGEGRQGMGVLLPGTSRSSPPPSPALPSSSLHSHLGQGLAGWTLRLQLEARSHSLGHGQPPGAWQPWASLSLQDGVDGIQPGRGRLGGDERGWAHLPSLPRVALSQVDTAGRAQGCLLPASCRRDRSWDGSGSSCSGEAGRGAWGEGVCSSTPSLGQEADDAVVRAQ